MRYTEENSRSTLHDVCGKTEVGYAIHGVQMREYVLVNDTKNIIECPELTNVLTT